jgi:uncharacterized protein (TIGR03437 family)
VKILDVATGNGEIMKTNTQAKSIRRNKSVRNPEPSAPGKAVRIHCSFIVAALLSVVPVAHAQTSIFGTNLIVNGGAESGNAGTSISNVVPTIPGWTKGTGGTVNVLSYGITGYLLTTSPSPPDRGFQYFVGAGYPPPSIMSQTIDISPGASTISAGNVKFTASAFLGSSNPSDYFGNAQMAVSFNNAKGQPFNTITLGPLSYPGNGMTLQQQIGIVPTGTVQITVTVSFGGINGGNGAADSLSLVLTTPTGTAGSVLGKNLVVNPGAETGPAAVAPAVTQYIPGWSTTAGVSVAPYGGTGWIGSSNPGPVDEGTKVFWGTGTGNSAYQDIDVSPAGTLIDAGQVTYQISVWLGATYPTASSPTLTYGFYDWSGNTLAATGTLGPLNRSSAIGMVEASTANTLPAGTRRVRITVTFGVNYDYVFDDVSFILATPSGPPVIDAGGVVNLSAFGGGETLSQGSWVEIYGRNLASTTAGWTGANFNNGVGPTSLQGISVSIGGEPSFVDYVSPGQVDVLLPSDAVTGATSITITNANGTSDPYYVDVDHILPSLLAPSSFIIGGKQYVAAFNPDGSFALPTGAVVGVSSHPATPGQTLVMYGIGFGPVSDGVTAGTLATIMDSLTSPLVLNFGTTKAALAYAGLVAGYTGLYQINVVVPTLAANSALPVTFTLGTTGGTQTLYIAVQQ